MRGNYARARMRAVGLGLLMADLEIQIQERFTNIGMMSRPEKS